MITNSEIEEELKSFDLEIIEEEGKLYVRTFEDRSTGIFGKIISPAFKNINELIEWWDFIEGLFLDIA